MHVLARPNPVHAIDLCGPNVAGVVGCSDSRSGILDGCSCLSRSEVEALPNVDELVEALGAALTNLSAGRSSTPPRVAAMVPEHAAMLAVMPAFLPSARALMIKLV